MIDEAIQSGIIEAEELHTLITDNAPDNLKILDTTFVLPTSAEKPHQNYYNHRIGDAIFFDIKDVADSQSSLPHMLPSPDHFSSVVGRLGISSDDYIVVYGQSGMVMGPARVWWMFRTFGHKNICVLNGGLPSWIHAGYELNKQPPKTHPNAVFTANIQDHLVCDIFDVQKANEDNSSLILDARAEGRFSGKNPEPRPGMRSGHIPKSRNLPCMSLINQANGKLKDKQELTALFDQTGYQAGISVINSCGSGVTACMIALALHHLGHDNFKVYDGSWSEWGQEASSMPIEVGS